MNLADPIHGAGHTTSAYRADGALASLAEPNGNTTTTGYDPLGRPIANACNMNYVMALPFMSFGRS